MMRKKKRTIRRSLWQKLAAVVTALAMVISMGITVGISAQPSHAAITGGEYTLTGQYTAWGDIESIPTDQLEGTEFTLYKVGGFSRDADGNSILVLSPALEAKSLDVNLAIKKTDDMTDQEWIQKWLESAQTIANAIKTDPSVVGEDEQESTVLKTDGTFEFTGLSNGLYLLKGEGKEVEDYPQDGQTSYWYPQPMLVQILNGNVQVQVKPVAEKILQFSLKKEWEGDDDVASLVRPEQITLIVKYNGEQVKEITLPDEHDTWAATWKAGKDQNDPEKWSVEEVQTDVDKTNYKWAITWDDTDLQRNYTLTNTYSRHELEITKITPQYLQSNASLSTGVVFELTGKDADGKQVYHNKVGMTINGPGKETITVSNIPTNIAPDGLTVKEIYAGGNYTPKRNPQTAAFTEGADGSSGTFSVTFENKYDDTTNYGSGIVNKYKLQKDNSYQIEERQGLPKSTQ